MASPVVHFEIIGKDAQGLRKFYSEAFGWQPQAIGGPADYAIVDNGEGIRGGIGQCPDGGYAGHVTFYVQVADINAALRDVERLGGKSRMEPMPLPNGGQFAHFEDPQGHMIGLVQP